MPRKRAKPVCGNVSPAVDRVIDHIQPTAEKINPLEQSAGTVWTTSGQRGEILLWAAEDDRSLVPQGLGVFHGAGVIAKIWDVPLGDRSGKHGLAMNPWNNKPMRIYASVEKAIQGETERWKQKHSC